MRNKPIVTWMYGSSSVAAIAAIFLIPLLAGCMDGPSRKTLNRGYDELHVSNYDQADADADEFLRAHPNGSGVAEAWYLKGRVEEGRAQDSNIAHTAAEKREYLDRAKEDYRQGLTAGAPSYVRAQLQTGVANVDFYEENYSNALREWQGSYENLPNDDNKAWVLYQIGRCQQRLGMFAQADKSFADVQKYYPGSEAASRAAMHVGQNTFYVEVGKFTDTSMAEKSAGTLRGQGFAASRASDAGQQIVRIGPLATYNAAKAVQLQVAREYPKAIIVP